MEKFDGFYFSYSVVPELSANSIAVVNQISALNNYSNILLFAIRHRNYEGADPREFYDLESIGKIILLPNYVMKCNYLIYSLIAVFYYIIYRPQFVYSRDILLSNVFCLLKIKNYYEIHQLDHDNDQFDSKFKSVLTRIHTNESLKKIICISNSLKRECKQFGIDDKKIAVLHSATGLVKRDIVEKADLLLQRPKIVYTGSTQPGKGIDVILQLSNLIFDCEFIIVGGHNDQFRYNKNIMHIPWTSPKAVKILLSTADICLLPNTSQRFKFHSPLKLFDYMAFGKAIVASNVDGVNEILIDNWNALLVPPDDINAFLKAIRTLLNNSDLKAKIEHNALITSKRYTWNLRAKSILKIVNRT